MMRWIIESSAKLRFLVVILAVVLLVFGFTQLRQMPINIYPEVNPPYVEVQTEALGLSAEEVEAFITVPMEADLLNGVAWLDQIYSRSVAGLSSVLLIFEPGTDPIRARQMVQERLTQAHALPNVSAPPVMLQPLSSSNRALMVGLSSDELSLIEMGVLSRWIIKPRLLGVPGVANVAIWGQRERQLQVQVDPQVLHENGVGLQQIIETAGNALWVSPLSYLESSSPGTAGWIDTPNQRLSVRHLLPITTADDLAQVAVVDKENVLLGDVATVVEDHQPLIGDASLLDGPGMILVIEKFPGANTLEVTAGVEKALADLAPGLQGMEIDSSLFRPANYIESAVGNLRNLFIIGAVLVILGLLAFTFQWRTALISIIAIPLALVAAAFILYLFGATFNVMLLGGMVAALVIIVHDAVVDVDSIARRLRERDPDSTEPTAFSIIVEAMLEVRGPLGFALLIILLSVLPIFFLPGLSASFIQPMATAYIVAIVASLLTALIVTPAMSVSLLSNASLKRESPLTNGLANLYHKLLAINVRSAWLSIIVAAVFIVVGLIALPFLNVQLLPELRQRDILIGVEAAPGTSRFEMNRVMGQAMDEIRQVPGVDNIGSHVGRAITGDAVVGINSGEIWVSIAPNADYDATIAAVEEITSGYPGIARQVQTYQPEQIHDVTTESSADIVVRLYGHELDIMREKAAEVAGIIAGIDGVSQAQPVVFQDEPQVEIEVDLAAAELHGLKPGDIRRQTTTLLSGIQVGNLFEEQKVFDVVVWGVPELRNNMTDIEQLLLDTPGGRQVPLAEVADVRIAPAATVIERDAVSRYVDITANVDGRTVDAVKEDIESAIQGVDIPFEYHLEVLNLGQGLQANQQRLIAIMLAVLAGIYLLLQAAFSSWRLAFWVFVTLPMALVGGVIAVLLGGGILTIGAMFGFFGLLAIAVRNAVLMVDRLRRLGDIAGDDNAADRVRDAARKRFAPIFLTALLAILALLPLLFAGNNAGAELITPMAGVIVGGVITSMLFNLFVVPAVYLRWPSPIEARVEEEPGLEAEPAPEAA
ncbi:MAG: efflux RND transporter permease subunit [Candidatus Promineifilaceae bacterium]|nr:efflux RND transporter permease subunit [Candidatus Promineifilaceae bacterium]